MRRTLSAVLAGALSVLLILSFINYANQHSHLAPGLLLDLTAPGVPNFIPSAYAQANTPSAVIGTGLPVGLAFASPTLTISSAGNGNGCVGLSGNTSGVATLCAPAIAGTNTNPIVFSNTLQFPTGSAASPSLNFGGGTGFHQFTGDGSVITDVGGIQMFQIQQGAPPRAVVPVSGMFGFSSTTFETGNTVDTALCRQAAGVVEAGDSGTCNTNGKLKAAGYMSVGTKFTSNAGCTEGTLVGGATAGKFTVGQNTACTIVITMGNSATAPNGWTCLAYDQTAVPAVAIRQTASNATTCSLLMTVATNDVITFSAIGY